MRTNANHVQPYNGMGLAYYGNSSYNSLVGFFALYYHVLVHSQIIFKNTKSMP
jgi:hypothetical protein